MIHLLHRRLTARAYPSMVDGVARIALHFFGAPFNDSDYDPTTGGTHPASGRVAPSFHRIDPVVRWNKIGDDFRCRLRAGANKAGGGGGAGDFKKFTSIHDFSPGGSRVSSLCMARPAVRRRFVFLVAFEAEAHPVYYHLGVHVKRFHWAMALLASDISFYVTLVAKPYMVRQVIDTNPLYGLLAFRKFDERFYGWTIDGQVAMATHTFAKRRNARYLRAAGEDVAKLAVDAQVARMELVGKGEWLDGGEG
jgi:hypothetical protein